ncbi:hypothetical protein [Streptomyces achromogenes]|uniref:hypothetical protein n=1 Tax=Streptomyces achromogenes TaxID=67255 RepID=UPI003A8031B8
MSAAAESATPPTPPTLNSDEGGSVLPFARRTRRSATNTRGGQPMETPPGKPAKPTQANPEQEGGERLVAEHAEKVFNAAGNRTLSDPETALAYVTTLGVVQHTLQGAAASGIISEEQRAVLAGLIAGLSEAPQYI